MERMVVAADEKSSELFRQATDDVKACCNAG